MPSRALDEARPSGAQRLLEKQPVLGLGASARKSRAFLEATDQIVVNFAHEQLAIEPFSRPG
jgi:hypothetical protein